MDGTNYDRGHWLNGRISSTTLAEIVAQLTARSGLERVDVSHLYGLVTGYMIESVESCRQSLQPLMLAYSFDSASPGELLSFFSRGESAHWPIAEEQCVDLDGEPVLSFTRAPKAETAERVALTYVRADFDYLPGATEASLPGAAEPTTDQLALPIVLSEGEAEAIAGRALTEANVARESLGCTLPPSDLALVAGDVLAVERSGTTDYFRIDRIEDSGPRQVTAVRVETGVYRASLVSETARRAPVLTNSGPVDAIFLDLPLLTGDENPVWPYVAAARSPWSGPVAVYSASQDYGYRLDGTLRKPAVFGETLEPLASAVPGLWSEAQLRVRLAVGKLESRSAADVLSGANVAALRYGGEGDWEVVQFRSAELVASREYVLSGLLRGQAGTDGIMPAVWPTGTRFLLLDGAASQIRLPAQARGTERHYRVGPDNRAYDDKSYGHYVEVFDGVGLRPYRPVHLAASRLANGTVAVTWLRRTRIDGDNWNAPDVPIGEEAETYLVKVWREGAVVREETVSSTRYAYLAADQAADGGSTAIDFDVAQVSARFGPGPFERIHFDG